MVDIKELQTILLEILKEFDRICKKHEIKYMIFCGSAIGAVRHQGFIPWDDDLDVAMLRSDYEKFMEVAPKELSDKYHLQIELSEHWPMCFSKLRKNNTTFLEKYHPKDKQTHQGIYIDIFPIDNASNNAIFRKIQFYCSKIVYAKSLYERGYETNSKAKKIFMYICKMLPTKPFHKIAKLSNNDKTQYVHSFLGCSARYNKGIFKRKWLTDSVLMEFEGYRFPVSSYYDELLTYMYGNYMQMPTEEEKEIKIHAILVDAEKNYSEYENYRDGMTWDVFSRNIH